jgi:tetratricopeptide (TPR) repeat protein
LRLDLDVLERFAGLRLASLGLTHVRLALVSASGGATADDAALELTARSTTGPARAELVVTLGLGPATNAPSRIRLEVKGLRIDGPAPLPHRELLTALLDAFVVGEREEGGEPLFDPVKESTFALFTDHGWRAPAADGLRFAGTRGLAPRSLGLRFVSAAPQDEPEVSRATAETPPRSADVPANRGWRRRLLETAAAAEASGDLDGAARALEEASRAPAKERGGDDEPDLAERAVALTRLGAFLERRGRFEAAAHAAASALTLVPRHAPALALLGDLSLRLGDASAAARAYDALAETPDARAVMPPEALAARRGKVAASLGRWSEAKAFWEAAARENPRDPEARQLLAEAALRQGAWPEAARHLEDVLRLLPLDDIERLTNTRHRLGETLANLGDWGGARYHLELVVSQDPQRTSAWETLADVTARLDLHEQHAAALERLSRIYVTAEQRAEALFRRGEVLREKLGDRTGALDAYLKASDLCPHHPGTAARLVEAFWRLGDYESLAGLSSDLFPHGQIQDAPPSVRLRLVLGLSLARRDSSPASDAALAALPWDLADVTEAVLEVADTLTEGPLDQLEPLFASLLRWQGPLVEHSLREALKGAWRSDPSRPGTLRALAWLADRSHDAIAARALYALVAFLEPHVPAAITHRLSELGPAAAVRAEALALGGPADHPDCLGSALPLRRALAQLAGPLQGFAQGPLGIAPRDDEGVPRERNVLARRLTQLLSTPPVRFVMSTDPKGRPPSVAVRFEPTRPATLRIPRASLMVNDAELTFLLVRALDVARNGLGSLADRPPEDIAAFLEGARRALTKDASPATPLVSATEAWLAQAEQLTALQAGVGEPTAWIAGLAAAEAALAGWEPFLRAAEHASHRFALLACRSPFDALKALARLDLAGLADLETLSGMKRREILRTSPLRALVEFMLSPGYAACLTS